jgi:hypothetical protein
MAERKAKETADRLDEAEARERIRVICATTVRVFFTIYFHYILIRKIL